MKSSNERLYMDCSKVAVYCIDNVATIIGQYKGQYEHLGKSKFKGESIQL